LPLCFKVPSSATCWSDSQSQHSGHSLQGRSREGTVASYLVHSCLLHGKYADLGQTVTIHHRYMGKWCAVWGQRACFKSGASQHPSASCCASFNRIVPRSTSVKCCSAVRRHALMVASISLTDRPNGDTPIATYARTQVLETVFLRNVRNVNEVKCWSVVS
jgi:hypothetical protein